MIYIFSVQCLFRKHFDAMPNCLLYMHWGLADIAVIAVILLL